MKSANIQNLQTTGLRLLLCANVLCLAPAAYAQSDDFDNDMEITGPKHKRVVKRNYKTVNLHGTIVEQATNKPLAGIQVQMLGNDHYTAMSKEDGSFTLKVPTFATSLYVFSPGYLNQQVAIRSNDSTQVVKIKMMSDKFRAMYSDGTTYTATNSFTASGNNAVIDDEIQNNLGADIYSINRSAAPDNGASMFIRGMVSLNADAQPLIVIDGIEQDMQRGRINLHEGQFNNILANISPEDIDKVQVLKNATALYGARGANGVILITTKRGHSLATRIEANVYAGVRLIPQLPTMMDASAYRNYATEMLGTVTANTKLNNPIDYHFMNDDPNGYYYKTYHNDTDWTDYVYRSAMTQNYSINVQGGDDIGMYNLSVGYMGADYTVKKNAFNRMNVRFNTDINILWNLTTKFDISISRTNNKIFDDGIRSDLTASTVTSPGFLSLIKSPIVTPYQYNKIIGGFSELLSDYDNILGQLGNEYSLANPVAILQNGSGDNKNYAENTYFNAHIEPTLTLGDFKITERLSYNLDRLAQRYHRPFTGVPSFKIESLGTVTSMVASLFTKEINLLSDTRVDWAKEFGKHTVSAFAGFRFNSFTYDSSDLTTEYNTTTNDKNPSLSASSGYQYVKGDNDVWRIMQWYGNVDYNYMNRYFATVSLLAEANSRFGDKADGLSLAGEKWALFPSVQLGWVITNETWFPKNSFVNYLRLNLGFDMSGNDGISNYAARTSFSAVRYLYRATGLQLTNIGNDEIKWENTQKFNFGLQAFMFDNRLGVNFDIYHHHTTDLLTMQHFKNPIGGINNYWTNGGTVDNNGFEAGINGKPIVSKDWSLELGASVGHYENKVKKLPEGSILSSIYGDENIITAVGGPLAQFYGYQTDGVFADDASAKAAGLGGNDYLYMVDEAGQREAFKAGDIHFVDQNGDGIIDSKDKVIIGDPNPDIYGNIFAKLTWKNLSLSLGFNYSLGGDVYNYQRSVLNSGSTFYNQQVKEESHWRYEGQQTDIPRLNYGDPMGNNRFSDRWIEDGSYLRLKTLNLSYAVPVPGSWSWLQGLTVWGEARNLLTLTKYTGSDPEFSVGNGVLYQGIDAGQLAQGRSFVVGFKVNL